MGLPVEQVVHLHEVDAVGPEPPHRLPHLGLALGLAGGPDLGGEEGAGGGVRGGDQVAGHRLGAAVHGGGVDDAPAALQEEAHHLGERRPLLRRRSHVEGLPGAEPDDAEGLAAPRDGTAGHRATSCSGGPGPERDRQHAPGGGLKKAAARHPAHPAGRLRRPEGSGAAPPGRARARARCRRAPPGRRRAGCRRRPPRRPRGRGRARPSPRRRRGRPPCRRRPSTCIAPRASPRCRGPPGPAAPRHSSRPGAAPGMRPAPRRSASRPRWRSLPR